MGGAVQVLAKPITKVAQAVGLVPKAPKPAAAAAPAAAPVPKAPPPPPSVDTPAVQAAAEVARRRERTARGRASTMLTGSQGIVSSDTQVGTKKLLGQ